MNFLGAYRKLGCDVRVTRGRVMENFYSSNIVLLTTVLCDTPIMRYYELRSYFSRHMFRHVCWITY